MPLISTMITWLMIAGLGLTGLLASPIASVVTAQERPRPAVEGAVGWVGFADDGTVSETLVGGAARVYLSPRMSVGPEVVYIQGERHSHLLFTGNLTWDVLGPIDGGQRRVTPFLVAGGGVFQTREQFFGEPFTSREGAFTAGGGIRTAAGDRLTAGVDLRIGWELHVRINGFIGVPIGR